MAKKKVKKTSPITAQSIAEAMAENMAANIADPNFEIEREHRNAKAAKKALEMHAKKLEEEGIKITTAQSVAEAMAANMAANMADPNYEIERERMYSEAAKKVFEKNEKKLAEAGRIIPKENHSEPNSKTKKNQSS
jgi:hypothetical protein